MTIEKATKIIKDYIMYDNSKAVSTSVVDALDILIKYAELQIATKPIYGDYGDDGYDNVIPYSAICPICGHEFEFGTWNDEENHHCPCGQAIDWENE